MQLKSAQFDEIAPKVHRLVARNPGMMTGPGTNTYLLGSHRFAVIDPGPLDRSHVDDILQRTGGRIDAVLVTHTHMDHSPAASLLAQLSGARVMGRPAPSEERQDASFAPDSHLNDGDVIAVEDLTLRALHTPGHASNHVCYLLQPTGLLFTGDHLMQGSTVVIAPPDGSMLDYLKSLARLQREPVTRLAPGHGFTIDDAQAEIARIVAHRLKREAKVMERLRALQPASISKLLASVYDDVDPRLLPLAKSSLWAHLLKLKEEGTVLCVRTAEEEVWNVASAELRGQEGCGA